MNKPIAKISSLFSVILLPISSTAENPSFNQNVGHSIAAGLCWSACLSHNKASLKRTCQSSGALKAAHASLKQQGQLGLATTLSKGFIQDSLKRDQGVKPESKKGSEKRNNKNTSFKKSLAQNISQQALGHTKKEKAMLQDPCFQATLSTVAASLSKQKLPLSAEELSASLPQGFLDEEFKQSFFQATGQRLDQLFKQLSENALSPEQMIRATFAENKVSPQALDQVLREVSQRIWDYQSLQVAHGGYQNGSHHEELIKNKNLHSQKKTRREHANVSPNALSPALFDQTEERNPASIMHDRGLSLFERVSQRYRAKHHHLKKIPWQTLYNRSQLNALTRTNGL